MTGAANHGYAQSILIELDFRWLARPALDAILESRELDLRLQTEHREHEVRRYVVQRAFASGTLDLARSRQHRRKKPAAHPGRIPLGRYRIPPGRHDLAGRVRPELEHQESIRSNLRDLPAQCV